MKKFDIFKDGEYLQTIEAENLDQAETIAYQLYPYTLDDDLLEVVEVE